MTRPGRLMAPRTKYNLLRWIFIPISITILMVLAEVVSGLFILPLIILPVFIFRESKRIACPRCGWKVGQRSNSPSAWRLIAPKRCIQCEMELG